jgi:hypothetical protein
MDLSRGYIDQVWLFLKKKLKSSNIAFIFHLEYRYVVLSRGMHHKEFDNVSVLKLSVRKVVPTLTSTSDEIYLSMAGAKQHRDMGFILVPAMGRTSSRGAL